jgi:hypothetical protein
MQQIVDRDWEGLNEIGKAREMRGQASERTR